jgi:hypothetical protein
MKPLLLALLILSSVARGQAPADAPLIQPVPGGYFVNEPGMTKLNTELAGWQRERDELRAQNARLTSDIVHAAARPALTWKSGLILLLAGAAAGATVTALVMAGAR